MQNDPCIPLATGGNFIHSLSEDCTHNWFNLSSRAPFPARLWLTKMVSHCRESEQRNAIIPTKMKTTTMAPLQKRSKKLYTTIVILLLCLCVNPTKAFFVNIGSDGEDTSLITSGSSYPDSVGSSQPIGNTNTEPRFRSNRYGSDFTYTLSGFVAGKQYTVQIGFAELWSEGCKRDGVRTFNVILNGAIVTRELDVAKRAGGCYRAHVETYSAEANSSGKFMIQFRGVVQNAIVSWIEVLDDSGGSSQLSTTNSKWIDMNENESYTARHECSFVQAGDKFYLFGGRESPRRLEAYDYASNTWSVQRFVPQGQEVNHFQATEYQGLIWVIGSYKDNRFPRETPSEKVLVYSPGNNVWIDGPTIPSSRRRGAAGLAVYQGKFYLLGGTTDGHRGGVVSYFDEYDPRTSSWRTLPDAPHRRDHFHAAVVGDKLYAVGGRRSSSTSNYIGDPVKEVDVYDFSRGRWETSNLPDDLPNPRSGAAVAVFGGKIMIMGGESDSQSSAYRNVEALDPATGKWSTLVPMNHPRHGIQAIVSGQGVFVTAGSPVATDGRQKRMEVYNQNQPAGTASVAGVLSVPSSVEFISRQPKNIVLRHVSGNEGIFIHSVSVTGSNQSNFRLIGVNDHILVDRNGKARLRVEYTGTTNDVRAQLELRYSGGKTKTVSLVGKAASQQSIETFLNAGKTDRSLFNDGSSDYEVSSSVQIRGTSTPQYFRSHRWSRTSFKYRLPGYSAGKVYEIAMGWAEIYKPTCEVGVGARQFHVLVNNQVMELNLDVLAAVGCETALVKKYQLSAPSDGTFTIELVPKQGNAMVSYIEITDMNGAPPAPTPRPPIQSPLPPPPPPSTGQSSVLINAGDPRETMSYIPSGQSTLGYSLITGISGTSTPEYFQSHRYSSSSFKYRIGGFDRSKTYRVELGFAELYTPNCRTGKRKFGIRVNGITVKSSVDVFAARGCKTAYVLQYDLSPNSSGVFELEFVRQVENPMVSMIKITEALGTPTAPTEYGAKSLFIDSGASGENMSFVTERDTRAEFRSVAIGGTSTPQYFRSHRWNQGSFGYNIGGFDRLKTYTVTFGFAELYEPACKVGGRVFDIKVNGSIVKSNVDVFAATGCEKAYTVSYDLLSSQTGSFEIRFIKRRQNPMVSFIDIKGRGGPALPSPTASPNPPESKGARVFFADSGKSGENMSLLFPTTTLSYSKPGSFNIRGTSQPEYFRSHRYASSSFGYKLKGFNRNRQYIVDLWFAEQYTPNCGIGKRVFDILVNGVERTSNLDVFAASGCETAHLESYTLQPSSSGEFEIILKKQNENPMISYIEVFEVSSSGGATPNPTPAPVRPTPAPVRPTPRPTPSPTPASSPSFGVNEIVLVDADRNQELSGALNCNPACVGSATKFNIRANVFGGSQVAGVAMRMRGPINQDRTEGTAPYALFGDKDGNYFGTSFPAGKYTVTAFAFNANGDESQRYTITFDIGQTVSSGLYLPPPPPVSSAVVREVDAGGANEDKTMVSGIPSFQFGNTAAPFISNTAEQVIFRTIRYGADFTYTIKDLTPNTRYEVVFGFAELWDPYCSSNGNRIFHVMVNGNRVEENLDVYKAAGGKCKKAHYISKTRQTDSQGRFKIRFVSVKDVAMVSLIQIKTI